MAREMENWQAALDFLPLSTVIDHAFQRAFRTGQTPYHEYAQVDVGGGAVLSVERGQHRMAAEFMPRLKADEFAREFNASFLRAFRL